MKMTNEFKVGLMTVAAGSVLMIAILFVNNFHLATSGYLVKARFNFLGDLKSNAPVEYAGGIKVGEVSGIHMEGGKAVVDLLITEKGLRLRRDSMVGIYSAGLLGSRYVQIGVDLGRGEELKSGDFIDGRDANNLDQTLSDLGDVLDSFEKMMGDPKAKEDFLHSFENMNKATDNLLALTVTSRAKIEKIIDELSKSSANVPKIMASAQKVSKSLEDLTGALNKKQISQSVKDLNNTLKIMNELANDIHNGKGTLGALVKDEKMADDVKGLVEELKAHPWRLLWKK